jgi:hypothetical protein
MLVLGKRKMAGGGQGNAVPCALVGDRRKKGDKIPIDRTETK